MPCARANCPPTSMNGCAPFPSRPRIALILAGLHTLEEMSQDYQQAFFGSYQNEKVSYLSPDGERQADHLSHARFRGGLRPGGGGRDLCADARPAAADPAHLFGAGGASQPRAV